MNPLHEQFVAETRELIQQATDDLVAAEREGFSEERIDRVFRAFHTLKGSAGVVDLPAMGLVLHAAEDLLAAIQAGRLGATSLVIDHALGCLDQVANWVDDFEAHQALPAGSGETARKMAEGLRGLLGGSAAQSPAVAREGQELPGWVHGLISLQRASMPALEAGTRLFALSYEPRAGCYFDGDDPLELMRRVPKLLTFQIEAKEPPPPLADFDPFSCNLRLRGISAATHAELATVFRLVPDQVQIVDVPTAAWPAERKANSPDDDTALNRAVLAEQAEILRIAKDRENYAGRVGSAMRAAAGALRYSRRGDWAERVERAGAAAIAQSDPGTLLTVIDEAIRSLMPDPASGGAAAADAPSSQPFARAASRVIRVDETRVDALVDLAGELIVVKNGFSHLAKRAEGDTGGHDLARAIREQNDTLERLAGELHGAVLQLRMVPLAQVFRSFPRLVRDMSQQLGKDVTLVTRGETTEGDKTVVDLLFEPLMHLVRNALDHGIETAEQRRAAGKPASATIVLQAARMGDRLVVEAVDDGRGIDPAVIRRRASEKKLMSADELAALSDQQVIDLVFAAGFSTASEVSDISGRGVGMDVVRATIERIGGRVALKSSPGAGTTVSLDLPTNIALLRIMVVEAGGQVFGIPMDAVSETIRLTPDRISRIKNNDGFVLHERVVPICSLTELMNLPSAKARQADVRLVVVAEVGGKTTALEVDAIRDRLEVVLKPMQGLLSNARGYAGTTLLGDGAVLLVLDLKEILP